MILTNPPHQQGSPHLTVRSEDLDVEQQQWKGLEVTPLIKASNPKKCRFLL